MEIKNIYQIKHNIIYYACAIIYINEFSDKKVILPQKVKFRNLNYFPRHQVFLENKKGEINKSKNISIEDHYICNNSYCHFLKVFDNLEECKKSFDKEKDILINNMKKYVEDMTENIKNKISEISLL